MTRERPIIFSGEMVRAILDGRKTMTRRIVKPQLDQIGGSLRPPVLFDDGSLSYCDRRWKCPYGEIGAHLWIKEAWRVNKKYDHLPPSKLPKNIRVWYEADEGNRPKSFGRYRHARFMPRWACRTIREITNIKVERVKHISEQDAKSEGLYAELKNLKPTHLALMPDGKLELGGTCDRILAKEQFKTLWESIHGDGAWDLNPWVWCIEFKRVN